MIKTMEIHNGIKISLQSDFARVPKDEYYLILEIRNEGMARVYIDNILNEIKRDMATFYIASKGIKASKKIRELLEDSRKKYKELKSAKNEIDENDSWLYSSPEEAREIAKRKRYIKTILIDSSIEISLWNSFTLIPEEEPHMILKIKNVNVAERYISGILSDLIKQIGYFHMERLHQKPEEGFGYITIKKAEEEYKKLSDMYFEAIPKII
ncbi:MAG: hypothetical protein ACLUFC_08975 [Anaerobutyricum hallii]|uniref:hypothetical protein n=1 Tax=Anaerobutyricum hallii TaxID=39488 RepID=UPI003993BD03